jgi:hypothetical protein
LAQTLNVDHGKTEKNVHSMGMKESSFFSPLSMPIQAAIISFMYTYTRIAVAFCPNDGPHFSIAFPIDTQNKAKQKIYMA